MPAYDYRCKACQHRFTTFYKTYQDYDAASPECPRCGSADVTRLISRVAIPRPSRDFSKMSSDEMLSVLESGDSRAVGEMFDQVGGSDPSLGAEYHEATQRLLRGESMEKVERDLSAAEAAGDLPSSPPPAPPPAASDD
jgi:putative FmdB family regulatory protein